MPRSAWASTASSPTVPGDTNPLGRPGIRGFVNLVATYYAPVTGITFLGTGGVPTGYTNSFTVAQLNSFFGGKWAVGQNVVLCEWRDPSVSYGGTYGDGSTRVTPCTVVVNPGIPAERMLQLIPGFENYNTTFKVGDTFQSADGGILQTMYDTTSAIGSAGVYRVIGVVIAAMITAPYSGAVPRLQTAKNTDVVSVQDFPAIGDGIADDTTAIRAALVAVGSVTAGSIPTAILAGQLTNNRQGVLNFGWMKTYLISDELVVPPGVTLNLNGSTIIQSNATKNAFTMQMGVWGPWTLPLYIRETQYA